MIFDDNEAETLEGIENDLEICGIQQTVYSAGFLTEVRDNDVSVTEMKPSTGFVLPGTPGVRVYSDSVASEERSSFPVTEPDAECKLWRGRCLNYKGVKVTSTEPLLDPKSKSIAVPDPMIFAESPSFNSESVGSRELSGMKSYLPSLAAKKPSDENINQANFTCLCKAPSGRRESAFVTENKDGTLAIEIAAIELGVHSIDVLEDGAQIHGSPFRITIIQQPDPRNVRMYGPGLKSGLIHKYQDLFHVDTIGAGAGELRVRVHGPKESFKLELFCNTENKRKVNVKYNPTLSGIYTINVFWSGEHITGSPHELLIAEDKNHFKKWLHYHEEVRMKEGLLAWIV